jgi:RNA-binding protein
MLTGKQRAELRAAANGLETILQVGKAGVTQAVADEVDVALAARELIKLRVQDSSEYSAREAAGQLAGALKAEVVQVIGSRFVLYRQAEKRDDRRYFV